MFLSFYLDPVVLDPNSAHISVSGDLVSASRSIHRFYSSNPLQKNSNRLVLGSEAQNACLNYWDVEVGDSKHWTLGVCRRSAAEGNHPQDLTPQNGFWGLFRDGDFYYILGSPETPLQLRRSPKIVRVKLMKRFDLNSWKLSWMLSFSDASNGSVMACIRDVAFRRDFFPFLIPEDKNASLRIVPTNVNITMEKNFTFLDRHKDLIPLYIIGFFMVLLMLLMLWLLNK